ncbi:MAG: glycosyltransferase family 1 protein [Herbinix sp.]|jgi:galacturonosyltransferase|nr:glycosyltransferase family 1 protein [Herbinix sp.]
MTQILVLANNDVGLYKFRKELLQELIRLNYKVYISLPKGDFVEQLINIGCEYIETPIDRRGTNPITDFKLLVFYQKIIKQVNPDVVLTYTIKPNIYGGLICSLVKVPYITNITGLGTAIKNKGILQNVTLFLYQMALKNAYCVFFQNIENNKFFIDRHIVKDNFKLLPGSGVNLDDYCIEEYPDNNNVIKFLFIGRIMKDKGVGELFDAAIKVRAQYTNVQFEVIGDCEEDYLNKLTDLEKQGIIKYHGRQNNVREFIKDSHAIILPSYHEGLANVLLEAAASGRPVLASRIPGCSETFDEDISGLGFKVKNVDSLIEAIIKFIEMPYETKKTMGVAGRKKMETEFSRKIVISAYINEIESKSDK